MREQVEAYEARQGRKVEENHLHLREKEQMDNINKRFKSLQELLKAQQDDLKSIAKEVKDLQDWESRKMIKKLQSVIYKSLFDIIKFAVNDAIDCSKC